MTWATLIIAKKYKIKIDRRDLARVREFNWYAKRTAGGIRFQSAPCRKNGFSGCNLGRFILNCDDGFEISFVNHLDEFNYRRSNLCVLSRQQRQSKLGKRKSKTTSQFKGVSKNKNNNKWRASICIDGQTKYLGEFETEHGAAEAYNIAARASFGDLAFQNKT